MPFFISLFPAGLFVGVIAFFYASVGFGGASGYLFVMRLLNVQPQIMASTALVLNIIVASISFFSFYRAGFLRRNLIQPFLLTSLPGAFLGGYLKVADSHYFILLYSVLTFVGIRLLFPMKKVEGNKSLRPVAIVPALVAGLLIGFLSGVVGIGGGIFLSPLILFTRWGTPKEASAVTAAFIVLNCVSGLLGRWLGHTLILNLWGMGLLPFGIIGGIAGAFLGAKYFSSKILYRILGMIMLLAVSKFWFDFWS